MLDYHVHSTCSGDAVSSVREMCARAVDLGITEIVFAEHIDNNPVDMCYGTFDLDFYLSEIESARGRFGDRLRIMTGAEFGEPHLYQAQLEELRSAGWADVILGAVHWVGEDIVAVDALNPGGVDDLYRRYFADVLKTVEAGGFQVLAHLDLVKRFGVQHAGLFRVEPFREQIESILSVMIESEIALEVNTSGLRQPCQEPFPSPEILRLYRDLGGELVTIGSDSHSTRQLGFGLTDGLEMIRSAGFDSITFYRNRRPERHSI